MRIILASVLLAMGLVLTGCYSTCDGRGPSDMCEVHHMIMHAELVKNRHLPQPDMDYMAARQQMFPHVEPFALPDQCDKCVVYLCEDCVKAEREWKRQHPTGK
jgi:hypothetical protein